MKRLVFFLPFFLVGLAFQMQAQPGCHTISLDGIWSFKADPLGMGLQSNGLQMFPSLTETITLPGSTDEAGKGIRTQGLSSIRLTRMFEYKGPAWYEKKVFIPEDWAGRFHYFLKESIGKLNYGLMELMSDGKKVYLFPIFIH